ncbi:MAG: H-NS histone family protein [Pseudomonadota bacterium]|nr:H-NS histone family protein [Pseudomonadota bacterium]
MDINNLNNKELADLIKEAQKRKRVLAKRKPINQVRGAVNKIVRGSGYTFEELFGAAKSKAAAPGRPRKAAKKVSRVEPKYADPANGGQTWSGRGKRPRWLAAYVDQGRNLDEFLISKPL